MGRALASAYSAVDQADLPDDMISLLNQLDSAPALNRSAQEQDRDAQTARAGRA